jgi:asparagine synthase (glutamine-hydrolysing)
MGRYTTENLPQLLHPDLHRSIPTYADAFYEQHYHKEWPPLKSFQYLDAKSFMGELVLVKIDRASMANSLEVRVPFLDHELFEFIFSLSPDTFFRKDQTKFLLRENIKSVLPQQILDRSKQGFVGPDKYYMDIDWYAKELRGGELLQEKIIQKQALERLILGKKHWELWKLVVLEKWWRTWVQ